MEWKFVIGAFQRLAIRIFLLVLVAIEWGDIVTPSIVVLQEGILPHFRQYVWWRWNLREFAKMFSETIGIWKIASRWHISIYADGWMIWHAMTWLWHAMIYDDMRRYDMTCFGMIWYGMMWYWYGMVSYEMSWDVFFLFSLNSILPPCGHGSLQIWNFQMTASHKSGCTRRMAGEWWDQRTSLQLVLYCRILLFNIIYITT